MVPQTKKLHKINMRMMHWTAFLVGVVFLALLNQVRADTWIGVSNGSLTHLRFVSIGIEVGSERRELLLRSLSAESNRIWFRIEGDKLMKSIGVMCVGKYGLHQPSVAAENRAKFPLQPGIYQLDINEKFELIVTPGQINEDAIQVVPLWDVTIVTLCDRIDLLDKPDIEKENKILNSLRQSYDPPEIPAKHTASASLMSYYSLGYQHGWYARSIPELTFEKVDYFRITPHSSWVTNKNEIILFQDTQGIFEEGFKVGWDKAGEQVELEE